MKCLCGCGQITTVYKGVTRKYVSGHNIQKGRVFSIETRSKLSASATGRKLSVEHRAKAVANLRPGYKSNLGKKLPITTRLKMSKNRTGEGHWNWQGGISSINTRIRQSWQAKQWRNEVYERDDYTCQKCGKRGGDLNVDHIKPFAYFSELRFEISNGRTLCVPCHKKTFMAASKMKELYGI